MTKHLTIDAHHHFWDPDNGDYSWMKEAHSPIRRVFTPDDFRPALKAAAIEKTILVQTWSSLDETSAFLALAEETDFIAGVVGWVDLTSEAAGDNLDALLSKPDGKWLVGVRHQVHDEADPDWLLRTDVRNSLRAIEQRGLTYDLLVRPRELAAALQTVADFPKLRFVINHIAKPEIAEGKFSDWATKLRPFGKHRDHVWCKLSGTVTEAKWDSWQPTQIRPYIDEVIGIFGAERCMFGSDWPVCLLAATYGETVDLIRTAIAARSDIDRAALFGLSAISAYRLNVER